jgi:hypothetical protein
MISAYADDILIIVKHRGNLNRVIIMYKTEFGKVNLKLNKKKWSIALNKPGTKEAEGI